jgi:glutaminyl-peptide cyclotransferase
VQIWGNVWQTNCIAIIDPTSAQVTGWVVLSDLVARARQANSKVGRAIDVLNGIAFDTSSGSFFLTGKYWSLLFEVKIGPGKAMSEKELASTREMCVPHVSGGLVF